MKKLIGIVAGDPHSINSEIIAKAWKKKSNFKNLNIFVIGNYNLIKKQLKILKIQLKLKKIHDLNHKNFKKELLIYDVPFSFNRPFNLSKNVKKKYIIKSLNLAIKFSKQKKIIGFVNCPINKSEIFHNNFGVTELTAKKLGILGREVMLIYNKKLSVCPITTHIKLKQVANNLSKKKIVNKIITINRFYKDKFKIKPRIGVMGLNPHNNELKKDSEEKKTILPAIKTLRGKGCKIQGPISADTAFLKSKQKNFDILVGMYHDQVLSPFKALFNFNAINITLGLPFLRVSPDHGTGRDIVKKNLANPLSLIESIKFFNNINVKA